MRFIYKVNKSQLESSDHLTLVHLCYQFRTLRNLRIDIKDRLEEYPRSSLISSFRSTLSNLKRGQQTIGALVAVVRSNRYIYIYKQVQLDSFYFKPKITSYLRVNFQFLSHPNLSLRHIWDNKTILLGELTETHIPFIK